MELQILKWFDATFHSQTWLNYLMKYITYIGEFGAGAIICVLVLLFIPKTRSAGFAAGAALLLDVLIVNVILKLSVNRARPWTQFPEIEIFYNQIGLRVPTDSSFPSGHTAACFAVTVVLLIKYKWKAIPALIVALLVALSRIYLCVHYPSDVLGGMLIGSLCGVGGYFISKNLIALYLKKRGSKKSSDNNELNLTDDVSNKK